MPECLDVPVCGTDLPGDFLNPVLGALELVVHLGDTAGSVEIWT
jgi:hypothetical protein